MLLLVTFIDLKFIIIIIKTIIMNVLHVNTILYSIKGEWNWKKSIELHN